MVELSTVARPYAEAVFRVAKHSQTVAQWADSLALWSAVAKHPDVLACFKNPKLGQEDVLTLFAQACKAQWSAWPQPHRNFLEALALQGRLQLLPEIEHQFVALKNQDKGAADAVLETAFALSESQLAELRPALEKRFGVNLNLSVRVLPELMGGVRVTVGDQILDSSVRAQLQTMKQALLA